MTVVTQSKRILLDIILALGLLAIYLTGFYTTLPGPVQLITLKAVLVSMAFIHAHLVGKIAFGPADWSGEFTPLKMLRIVLYAVFIFAYSTGG